MYEEEDVLFDLQRCKSYKIFSGKVVGELTAKYSIDFARLTPKRTNEVERRNVGVNVCVCVERMKIYHA